MSMSLRSSRLQILEAGAFKPVIDRRFKFDDMLEVHRYLESNSQFGKVVVTV
jgi:NADPH:quinone reductase-like Zn-dependent oxidoreductase